MSKIVKKCLFLMTIFILVSCGSEDYVSEGNMASENKTKTVEEVNNDNRSRGSKKNENDTQNNIDYSKIKKVRKVTAGSNIKRDSSSNKQIQLSDIDIDLTKYSSTMVYAEVNNMMNYPDEYLGKLIRIKGDFEVYEGQGRNYYACIIKDAMACCEEGIEFVLRGQHNYPDDYPKTGQGIIVTGVFDTYYEGDRRYCQLIDSSLVKSN